MKKSFAEEVFQTNYRYGYTIKSPYLVYTNRYTKYLTKARIRYFSGMESVGKALISNSKTDNFPLSNFSQHILHGQVFLRLI